MRSSWSPKLITGVSENQTKGVRARAERIYYLIIGEIAKEEGLTEKKTELIIRTIFQNLAEQIRTGDNRGISMPYFGTFKMKPTQEKKYKKKLNGLNT